MTRRVSLVLATLWLAAAQLAGAQSLLPPIPPTRDVGSAAGGHVVVRSFRLTGAEAIGANELGGVLAPYLNRELDAEELVEVRDLVTRAYAARGFVGSSAEIPSQPVADGEVEILVHEGRLGSVIVEGAQRLDPDYIRSRLAWAGRAPLNRDALARELEALRMDPQISRLSAELRPGDQVGELDLDVRIEEAPATFVDLHAANDLAPALGGAAGGVSISRYGLLGRSDMLQTSFDTGGRGLSDFTVDYSLPVHPSGTEFVARVQKTRSHVVEQPFADLDIDSDYSGYGFGLRQPLYRDLNFELWLGLLAERRWSQTFLLSEPFGFAPGHENGNTRLNVLRFFQDATFRTRDRVVALRSTVSAGRDLNGKDSGFAELADALPDSRFVAWLGQAQWAERLPLPLPGSEIVGRLDLQLSGYQLSSLEQLSLGGLRTVRGYPENALLRDSGMIASLELRVPILRSALGENWLQLAPFFDYGRAWNKGETVGPHVIDSAGVGLRSEPFPGVSLAVYWGARLRDVPNTSNDLQRAGFSIETRMTRSF